MADPQVSVIVTFVSPCDLLDGDGELSDAELSERFVTEVREDPFGYLSAADSLDVAVHIDRKETPCPE